MNVMNYLGREWQSAIYDCWGHVRDVYFREKNISLPLICINAFDNKSVIREFRKSGAYDLFDKVLEPEHLCVVLMGNRESNHCGVYLSIKNKPMIMHNKRGFGVLVESIETIKRKTNILSYHRLKIDG